MSIETPANVAANAAIPNALPLDEVTLIGLFANADGNSALLRSPAGDILRVVAGDTALGLTVQAIDDTGIVLTGRDGIPRALTMPTTP